MMVKIPRNEAYGLLRKLEVVPCINQEEEAVSSKLKHLTAGKLVDQMQSYADHTKQSLELSRRCRAAGLKFFFDAGQRVQFRKNMEN